MPVVPGVRIVLVQKLRGLPWWRGDRRDCCVALATAMVQEGGALSGRCVCLPSSVWRRFRPCLGQSV